MAAVVGAATSAVKRPRALLITFDAFQTLYSPKRPIPEQYFTLGSSHGVVGDRSLKESFSQALNSAIEQSPNYGKASGMTPEQWWGDVVRKTFQPYVKEGKEVPQSLVEALYKRFSGNKAYELHDDVLPFLRKLRGLKVQDEWKVKDSKKLSNKPKPSNVRIWPYTQTIVGVVSNSDDRIGPILRSLDVPVRLPDTEKSHSASSAVTTTDDTTIDALQKTAAVQDDQILVDFIVSSYDAEIEKPAKGIWDKAFEKAQILSRQSGNDEDVVWDKIHVGDHFLKDAVGARDAGWKGIHLRRNFTPLGKKLVARERAKMENNTPRGEGLPVGMVKNMDKVFKYVGTRSSQNLAVD